MQVASNSTQGLAPLEGRGEVSDSNRTLYEIDFKCIILFYLSTVVATFMMTQLMK